MKFEFWQAVLASLIAGAMMEGPVYLQKSLGWDLKQNIFRTWGRIERVEPFLWEGRGRLVAPPRRRWRVMPAGGRVQGTPGSAPARETSRESRSEHVARLR